MPETRKVAADVQDEILNTVRKSQSAVIEALQTWTATIQSMTPDLPEMNLPFSDKLPRPQDMVSGAYDFAEKLLASQRKFAEDVVAATAPMLGAGAKQTASK